ncbi:hypothetical protein KSAC_27860 [Komagataeibacter saccharivorans]|uniref:ABC-three component system protein n=1 Tax=Komagataeibacter saccharivorans TaxID=265959 RepID=UPI001046F873|nr:ABC-three component system protein [Komagataeibacter saccharivorans]QBL94966.1 hypothetical protein KSAC_27860 [Komagataeibacter saccharivorans]
MIPDTDLKNIDPKMPTCASSAAHVHSGVPIPPVTRVKLFSPDDWEAFVEEWANSLKEEYVKVRRLGGSGDLGVDIVGFGSAKGFEGVWDNYQCKRYDHPLRPSDIWVEIGKIIYYSHQGKYIPPRRHYFVSSQDIGTSLEKLLNKPTDLQDQAEINWDKYCKKGITATSPLPLTGILKEYFDSFDFSIFSSRSLVELIEAHKKTGFHAIRFGGGLPQRPNPVRPPEKHTYNESRYIRQLLDAYGDHIDGGITKIKSPDDLDAHDILKRDYLRQRERFYHAESLRNFARDTVPEGTYDALQNEIYHGIVDVCESGYDDGFERMKATVAQASTVAATSNPLVSAVKTQDRQGICHQLANDDRLTWVQKK